MFYSALRKFLFSLSAENAHDFSLRGIDLAYKLGLLGSLSTKASLQDESVNAMGLKFAHPVGLAAGILSTG